MKIFHIFVLLYVMLMVQLNNTALSATPINMSGDVKHLAEGATLFNIMTTSLVPYSKQIELSKQSKNKGKYFAIVGYWWYDWLNQWRWNAHEGGSTFYVRRRQNNPNYTILMHRVILGLFREDKEQVDHIDFNGLNNCNNNLRIATAAENKRNRKSLKNSSSKYLGVCMVEYKTKYFRKKSNTNIVYRKLIWRAQIKINNRLLCLGDFPFTSDGEIEAARAYDKASKEHYGEFANPNFPT